MQKLAYWLIPAPRFHEVLTRIIRDLAARCDSPPFEPHVTMFSGEVASFGPAARLDELPSADNVLAARPVRVTHSAEFTRSIFIELESNPRLDSLSEALRQRSGSSSRYSFQPHVSLAYGQLPGKTRSKLAASIVVPFQEITFSELAIVAIPPATRTCADVRAWRIMARCSL